MQAVARFRMDRAYFEENYSEWRNYRSRFRRWQRHIAAGLLVAGCAVIFLVPSFSVTGIVLVSIAIAESVEFYWHRASWLGKRLAARGSEPVTVVMSFDEAGVHITGPASTGQMPWNGVHELRETPKGLFFRIGDGMSIYVPKSALEPQTAAPELVRLAGSDG
jgi:YcxB-like protein